MDTKTFIIRNYYERHVPLDDGVEAGEGNDDAKVPLRIRRFTVDQLEEFQRGWNRIQNPPSERFIFRKSDGDEQAKDTRTRKEKQADGTERDKEITIFVVPDVEVRRRRIQEMTPEQREAFDTAERDDEKFMLAFCVEAITDHMWVKPGITLHLENESGETVAIKDGADLVKVFGGNFAMLTRLTRAIHEENTLSAEAKKDLRSRSISTPGSPASAAAVAEAGPTPDGTAAPAVSAGSAATADATASSDPTPSGSTTTS